MAQLARAPLAPPEFDYRGEPDEWRKQEQTYIDRLARAARDANPRSKSPLIGRTVRFSVADGYAVYVVWSVSPLVLVHVATGDGYAISAAHLRGLTLRDIKALVANEDMWSNLTDDHERFYASLPVGSIVHYHNSFGRFVRAVRVEGPAGKRLRPIALVGNWPAYDLPRRLPNGDISREHYPDMIESGERFEPHYSNIWEAQDAEGKAYMMRGFSEDGSPPAHLNDIGIARFREQRYQRPFDPAAEPAIDLSVPDMTPEQERLATLARRLDAIRLAVNETFTDEAEYRAALDEVSSIVHLPTV
jgi:hypothetical protein